MNTILTIGLFLCMVHIFAMEVDIPSSPNKMEHRPLGKLDEQILQLAASRYGTGILLAQLNRERFSIKTIKTDTYKPQEIDPCLILNTVFEHQFIPYDPLTSAIFDRFNFNLNSYYEKYKTQELYGKKHCMPARIPIDHNTYARMLAEHGIASGSIVCTTKIYDKEEVKRVLLYDDCDSILFITEE